MEGARALAYARNPTQIAVGSWKGDVRVWDEDFKKGKLVDSSVRPVHSLTFFEACGRRQLAIGKGNELRYEPLGSAPQSTTDCKVLPKSSIGDEVYALAFDGASQQVAAATRGGYVAIVDPRDGSADRLRTVQPGVVTNAALRGAIVADDGSTALLAMSISQSKSEPSKLEFFRVTKGRVDGNYEHRKVAALNVEFARLSASVSSRRLATLGTSTNGHRVDVWEFDDEFTTATTLRSLTSQHFPSIVIFVQSFRTSAISVTVPMRIIVKLSCVWTHERGLWRIRAEWLPLFRASRMKVSSYCACSVPTATKSCHRQVRTSY